MSRTTRRRGAGLLVALLLALGLTVVVTPSATACLGCSSGSDAGATQDTSGASSTTQSASYNTSATPPSSNSSGGAGSSCYVFANGTGMGASCVQPGGPAAQYGTLRERYQGQELQRCRFTDVPQGIQAPPNMNPDKGRYMLRTCLENVDLDTAFGGTNRSVSIGVYFVDWGTDVKDVSSRLNDFMWEIMTGTSGLMPVPFLKTEPQPIPLVGVPTYFTFRWLDPATQSVVAQGPFANTADGGPYKEIQTNGFVIRAEATTIEVNPNQSDIPAKTCPASTPYDPNKSVTDQPADACMILFKHSSASAQKYSRKPLPPEAHGQQYLVDLTVNWRVSYGHPGTPDWHTLGNDFKMHVTQLLPVQEVQVTNQPPSVIY